MLIAFSKLSKISQKFLLLLTITSTALADTSATLFLQGYVPERVSIALDEDMNKSNDNSSKTESNLGGSKISADYPEGFKIKMASENNWKLTDNEDSANQIEYKPYLGKEALKLDKEANSEDEEQIMYSDSNFTRENIDIKIKANKKIAKGHTDIITVTILPN